jgi:hypothetical protein
MLGEQTVGMNNLTIQSINLCTARRQVQPCLPKLKQPCK